MINAVRCFSLFDFFHYWFKHISSIRRYKHSGQSRWNNGWIACSSVRTVRDNIDDFIANNIKLTHLFDTESKHAAISIRSRWYDQSHTYVCSLKAAWLLILILLLDSMHIFNINLSPDALLDRSSRLIRIHYWLKNINILSLDFLTSNASYISDSSSHFQII
jgi:hypothetical protein